MNGLVRARPSLRPVMPERLMLTCRVKIIRPYRDVIDMKFYRFD